MNFARFKLSPARFLIGAAVFALSSSAFSQNLLMIARPVFDNLQPGSGVVPVEVDLANTGADARGVVQVHTSSFTMTYPVELPQGTRKKLITYPNCGQYSSDPLSFDLVTNRGRLHQTMPVSYSGGQNSFVVGEIAENGGDLAFLRTMGQKNNYEGIMSLDAYVKPADAPTRPVGYQRLTMVVLGDGAERLSDDSVSAIKVWALSGGIVVFLGGASSPVINDARWADLMPIHSAKPQNMTGSKSLETLYGSSPKPFTAMIGEPDPASTSRAHDLIVERPIGLGRAVYLAFNPFENPMLNWNGRPKLFAQLLSPGLVEGPKMAIASVVGSQDNSDPYGRYGGYGSASMYGGDPSEVGNPFQARLPASSEVLLILGLYFLAVVPINFFVLRKLKRGELAWATAPLLSLAFAAVFFGAAQGLYSADLSTSTKGLVVMQEGEPNAVVMGYTQMFFPRGGNYDLQLASVDSLNGSSSNNPYDQERSIYEDLDAADTGEIHSTISVPNLAFREIRYVQKTQVNDWFDVRRLPNGHIAVTNKSPYSLDDARLVGGGGSISIGTLAPGAVKETAFSNPALQTGDFASQLGQMLNRSRSLALTGTVHDFRVGPQLGKEVKSMGGLTIAFVSNEKLRGNELSKDSGADGGFSVD